MTMLQKAIAFVFVAFVLGACSGRDARAGAADGVLRGRVVLSGSSTMAPLLAEIAKRFESRHGEVRIDVQTGGSSRGLSDVAAGLADLGMTSRQLTETESAKLTAHVMARDGVTFIVNAANPIEALTDAQLRDVYTGRVVRWSEVGGLDAPITVLTRATGRSELEMLFDYLAIESKQVKAHAVAGENLHGIKQVATDPNAICFLSVGSSEFAVSTGEPIKLLPLRGRAAAVATVASGQFPWSRPLILACRPEVDHAAGAFLQFALSDEVHDLIRDHSFVATRP